MKHRIKYLVVPDVHGRTFWRKRVKRALRESDAKIIFLGDYVDPYPEEWLDKGIYFDFKKHTIKVFKEILDLKEKYGNRIILLLGNHDCSYAIGTDICESRYDRINAREIEKLFNDNYDKFDLAYEDNINGKHFVFSHAGISRDYALDVFGNTANEDNVVSLFNKGYHERNFGVIRSLGIVDFYRSYFGNDYASLVWADFREWFYDPPQRGFGYMIFGHTQLKKAFIDDVLACIDVKKVFSISDKGKIKEYNN